MPKKKPLASLKLLNEKLQKPHVSRRPPARRGLSDTVFQSSCWVYVERTMQAKRLT
jgi:hypothetical protein